MAERMRLRTCLFSGFLTLSIAGAIALGMLAGGAAQDQSESSAEGCWQSADGTRSPSRQSASSTVAASARLAPGIRLSLHHQRRLRKIPVRAAVRGRSDHGLREMKTRAAEMPWGDVAQPLTHAEKLAVHNELKRAFPQAPRLFRQEARLRRAIEHARLLAREPAPLKMDQIRPLVDAVRDAEHSFAKADRARIRLHKSLKTLSPELARRLVERAIEREVRPVEVAEARAWHRGGDPLGFFVYQLKSDAALKETVSLIRLLRRVFGSKRGAPKKQVLTDLTLTIALVYFKFAGTKNVGVYTSTRTILREKAANLLPRFWPSHFPRIAVSRQPA